MSKFDLAYTPFRLRNLELKNRFIKTATAEGMCESGLPKPELVNFHERVAAGGLAMTTIAYAAVSDDGRTDGKQLFMAEAAVPNLRKLTEAVHAQGAHASIQLTHCGYFTKFARAPISASRNFNNYGALSGIAFSRAMTPEDLDRIKQDFAAAAGMASEAGFDVVELHMGHGYLLSQFISPKTNRREDRYGGSLNNRMRFPIEVYQAVRKAVGDRPVICKVNLSDGFPGGSTVDDCIEMALMLQAEGVDALLLSGGSTSKAPFHMLRGEVPLKEMAQYEESFMQRLTMRFLGPIIVDRIPFEPNFFLEEARRVREAITLPLIYVGGVVSRTGIEQIMNTGFDLIALGRAVIHDADFITKIRSGEMETSPCNHCNLCVAEIGNRGVRCVLDD